MARFEVRDVKDPEHAPPEALQTAARMLVAGGLVAFPTETVYGLGARADDPRACRRIYEVKGRPSDNPLIVHFASLDAVVAALGPLPEWAIGLARAIWPGPLTLVLARPRGVFEGAAAGLPTLAVRVPRHPVALALLREAGLAVAAPSANRSGRPSPTRATDVIRDLEEAERLGADLSDVLVLDGGSTDVGVESTVVDVTEEPAAILRQGGLPQADVAALLDGKLRATVDPERSRRSPGTRYRHYAPKAPVWLWEEDASDAGVAAGLRVMRQERGCAAASGGHDPQGPLVLLAPPARIRRLQEALAALEVPGDGAHPRGDDLVPFVSGARARAGPAVANGPWRLQEPADGAVAFPAGGDDDPECEQYAHGLFTWLREADDLDAWAVAAEIPRPGRGGWSAAVRDRLLRAAAGRYLPMTDPAEDGLANGQEGEGGKRP